MSGRCCALPGRHTNGWSTGHQLPRSWRRYHLTGANPSHRAPVDQMDPEERLLVIETALRFFLVTPEEDDYLIVQSMSLPCNYVQLRFNENTLWAEALSRQWDCPYCGNRPLPEEKEIYLSGLGFAGGGPHQNYESRSIGSRPRGLAQMLEQLLITAFNEQTDFCCRRASKAARYLAVYHRRRCGHRLISV
jgi:hypothetical protein